MRRLFPDPTASLDLDELVAAYAVDPPSRTHVRAMMVASADGAATVDGRSGGLGSDADRRLLSLLRDLADVVLVGAATVTAEDYTLPRSDDARLARRADHGVAPRLRLAIASSRCDLSPDQRVFTTAEAGARPLVLTTEAAPRERREALGGLADVVVVGEDTVDIPAALEHLAGLGLRRVDCEGGPRLLASIAAAGCLDELCLTLSPRLVGGSAGRIARGDDLDMGLELRQVLEDEGFLFLRYARGAA